MLLIALCYMACPEWISYDRNGPRQAEMMCAQCQPETNSRRFSLDLQQSINEGSRGSFDVTKTESEYSTQQVAGTGSGQEGKHRTAIGSSAGSTESSKTAAKE